MLKMTYPQRTACFFGNSEVICDVEYQTLEYEDMCKTLWLDPRVFFRLVTIKYYAELQSYPEKGLRPFIDLEGVRFLARKSRVPNAVREVERVIKDLKATSREFFGTKHPNYKPKKCNR